MLVVRVYIWPFGDRSRERLLQEATVVNVGGDGERGDYDVALSEPGSGFAPDAKAPGEKSVWRRAKVKRHDRTLSPAHLIAKALKAALKG